MTFAPGSFHGQSDSEIALFRKVLAGLTGTGVEIGCMDGFSTAHLLEASELQITSIDPLVPDSCEPLLLGDRYRFWLNVLPWIERVRLVEDRSEVIAPHWKLPIDLLFIDGDHTLEAVERDFMDWTPFVKVGGLLAVHDCRMSRTDGAQHHPGPSQVADKWIFGQPEKWEIVGEAHSLAVARKL